MCNDLPMARLKYCSQRRRKASPFLFSSSSALLAVRGGELIASERRLFSHGPLVHLILTRWRVSDNETVKCARGDGGAARGKYIRQKKREKKISVCAFEALSFTLRGRGFGKGWKRSLIASGSAASAGKLNKHRHSCFAVQIYVSEGLGAMHAARCGSSAAKQRRAPSCPLEPSRIILFFLFFTSSAAG